MNERLTIQDLTDLLATRHSMTKKDAEAFVKEFFLLIEEALGNDKYVKIRGLGTFRLTEVDSRESVKVITGERFQIKGHTKVSFTPDTNLRDVINKPFAHFETVVLNENTVLEDTPVDEGEAGEEDTTEDIVLQNATEYVEDVAVEQVTEPEIEQRIEPEIEIDIEQVTEAEQVTKPEMEVEQATEPVNEESEVAVEQIIQQEPMIAVLKPNMEKPNPEEVVVSIPKKEKSPIPYLVATIAAVLLLCGGVILFIYYPDLLSPSPASKELLDMPVAAKPSRPETELLDSIEKKDTVAIPQKDVMAEKLPAKEETPQAPIAKPVKPVEPVKQQSSTSVYSDSSTYAITGTKATHTIKQGESLTRVALKYYGTKAMWPYIVKHNVGIIKNPDNVPYGTTIKIPELTKK